MNSDQANKITNKVGLKLVEIVTRPENIPFYRGDLRKSITYKINNNVVTVGSNLVYARAVHDGRPPVVLRPAKGKILCWWKDKNKARSNTPFPRGAAFGAAVKAGLIGVSREVHLPAMKGNPYMVRALTTFKVEGFDFLRGDIEDLTIQALNRELRGYQFKRL